jgi:hypothetical protein
MYFLITVGEVKGWLSRHEQANFYSLPSISDSVHIKITWVCSTHREMRITFKILVGRPEGKRSLGTRNYRWKDNIKMGTKEL